MQKYICLALGLILSVGVFAQTWKLDKNHSQLNWGVTHNGISTVEGGFKMTGDLTLHGVTKSVTLNVTFNGTYTNTASNKISAGFHIGGVIKRSDFGIGSAFPANLLGDDVNLDANTEFIKG
jgi:polyisoprenoid-binding protein YceI